MSKNHKHNGKDDTRAARRTAHALGQTAGDERAEMEREMARSAYAREEVESIAALAARLKDAALSALPIKPSGKLRAAVKARLAELESAARPTVRRPNRASSRRMSAAAIAAACLVVIALPMGMRFLEHGTPREVAKTLLVNDPVGTGTSRSAGIPIGSDVVNLTGTASSPFSLQATYDPSPQDPKSGSTYGNLLHTEVGGQTLPAPWYLHDDVQYFEPAAQSPNTQILAGVSSTAGTITETWRSRASSESGPMNGSSVLFGDAGNLGGIGQTSATILPGTTLSSGITVNLPHFNFTGGVISPAAGMQPSPGVVTLNNSNTTYGGVLSVQDQVVGNGAVELPALRTAQAVIAANNAPGLNANDTPNPVGNSGLGTNLSVDEDELFRKPGVAAPACCAKPPDQTIAQGELAARKERRMGLAGALHTAMASAITGSGALMLTGTNTYAGGMLVNRSFGASGGSLQLASGGTIPITGNAEKGDSDTMVAVVQLRRDSTAMREALKALGQSGEKEGDGKSAIDGKPMPSNKVGREAKVQHVAIETLPGLDRMVIKGNPQDVALVEAFIHQYESLSSEDRHHLESVDAAGFQAELARLSAAQASKKQGKTSSQKPLESWKPARAVPNASRLMVGEKEELPLKGMQVDVRVDGFRARVLLDLYYFNDRPQQLEGNFQLRLPDEAAPYFFAFGRTVYQAPQITASDSMFFKPEQVSLGDTTPEKILALRGNSWEQPKVARMVPKEKAAMAYRDTVRRRIDPALVEWSGAGVFQCKVFPLAPQSLHRVTIGYDVDLNRVGDDLELRLDLPEWQSGGNAPPTVVDLNVAASDSRQVSLDSPATQSPDGRRLAYHLVDPKQRPLTVRLRKPGTLMLTGNDEATGNYFATRVTLPLPESNGQGAGSGERGTGEKGRKGEGEKGSVELGERSNRAIFLVDTSLSAGPQFPLWTKMLRATLTNNRDQIKQFAVLFFNVETFWWQEKYVDNTPENVDAVLTYADNLALEGATDLGRALTEAAAPKWRKAKEDAAPDLFLLSDGAATWGEDRWGLLASALTPGPSPKGRGETSALFAYRTGLAGGDSRLLGYLAERTGGAVFSLVSEAEIASASVAHRNRPWKLTNLETAGGHDVLVAGRPQYVYPGQQLTIVGRLEQRLQEGERGRKGEGEKFITFTLQQGSATQTIKVAMEQIIPSELAGRTFGQVATNQLEDVATLTPGPSPNGRGESVEPVATAYARHFRITGRTCSLLMLESEQDYARFNIKPEEDDFVVKQQPADPIVSTAITETVAAMSDPKATFLAWYNRLATSETRFELPASLKVYIDSLPEETFAVLPQPLACKMRQRKDLPENLRQQWLTGLADYDTLDAEAQRRLSSYGADDALRCLSSLVEERPGDAVVARDLAFTAIDWQRPGEAYHLLRRASNARTFEPITFHAMARCLEQMASTDKHAADLAIVYYELACGGQWDQRFGDMHNIALLDYARFLRKVAATKTIAADYAQSRLNSLNAMNLRDTADVAALIFWNTDGTDVDLHVVEPSGEECFYQHTQTASGGHISRDVTTGYGPELYLLPKAPSGRYEISAHYFATDVNRASTRTKVLAFIYENWGAKDERLVIKSLALNGQKERHELGVVKR